MLLYYNIHFTLDRACFLSLTRIQPVTKATEVKKASSEIGEDEEGEDNKEGSVASGHTRRRIGIKGPKMPCFDERCDDMDSFMQRFEIYADSQRWSKGQWTI